MSRTSLTKSKIGTLARQKDNALAKVRALQKETEESLSPVEMSTWVMTGALISALAQTYATAEQAQQLRVIGGIGAVGYGATQGQPAMVAIGLGMTASMFEAQVKQTLGASRQAPAQIPAAPQQLTSGANQPAQQPGVYVQQPVPVTGTGG